MPTPICSISANSESDFDSACDSPTLLKGWARNWPAFQKWNLDYLKENFGQEEVRVSNYKKDPHQSSLTKPSVKLGDYVTFLQTGTSADANIDDNVYLAGWHFMKACRQVMDDITIPKCFENNLLDKINERVVSFDPISFFLGHEKVESPLHTDSFAVSVWLANLYGTKVVRLVPPRDYQNIKNGMDAFSDEFCQKMAALDIPVHEVTLEAGDILFIPPGYWHQVKNLGITIAISCNYVNQYHFLPFEQQLRAKIMAPYMKLLQLKNEVVANKEAHDFSKESFATFNMKITEQKFLDFMNHAYGSDQQRIKEI